MDRQPLSSLQHWFSDHWPLESSALPRVVSWCRGHRRVPGCVPPPGISPLLMGSRGIDADLFSWDFLSIFDPRVVDPVWKTTVCWKKIIKPNRPWKLEAMWGEAIEIRGWNEENDGDILKDHGIQWDIYHQEYALPALFGNRNKLDVWININQFHWTTWMGPSAPLPSRQGAKASVRTCCA